MIDLRGDTKDATNRTTQGKRCGGRKMSAHRKLLLFLLIAVLLAAGTGLFWMFTGGMAQFEGWKKFAGYKQADSGKGAEDTSPITIDIPEPEPKKITISFTGDCILGTDENFGWETGFNAYYERNGADYFLKNVRHIFEQDDLTVINMEGTLTEETARQDKQFAFKGAPEFVNILSGSSVETANLANNHSHDYGQKSYQDTIDILEDNGVDTFGYDDISILDVKGVRIGIFGIYELDDHLAREPQMRQKIEEIKAAGANLIIGVFHWSNELETVPDANQLYLGHLAVDLGADVIVGHHPHILQGIEEYNGATIAYSLGNFCFGGNTRPREMDTIILQKTFYINNKGEIVNQETNIIPCCVSSNWSYNDYCPTPVTGAEAEAILRKVQERSDAISY